MSQLDFTVNSAVCTRCGQCVADCPAQIIAMEDGGPTITPDREASCYRCQHCLAICPTGAVSILGLRPTGSRPLSGNLPEPDKLEILMKGRRSVRRYKQENLDPGLLQRLLDVAWHAPTGRNSRNVLFTVIDDREILARVRDELMEGLGRLVREGRLPEGMELYADFVQLWEESKVDVLFRGAPHLLIASAPAQDVSPVPNCLIALSYFELFAQSLGVGTVWNGLTKLAINDLLPETRCRLGIPEDHVIGYVISFGLPAVRFPRTVQRGPARVNRVV
jgi:nitroreductase/NAD-dependent dihydropyrimidine dehydrogenase PreA subunit